MKLALGVDSSTLSGMAELLPNLATWGYRGLEIAPGREALERSADQLGDWATATRGAGLELAAVCAGPLLAAAPRGDATARETQIHRLIETAHTLESAHVVVEGVSAPPGVPPSRVMQEASRALGRLLEHAGRQGLRLALENRDRVARSVDVWFLRDAARSPAVEVCICPAAAVAAGEAVSVLFNRLAGAAAAVRIPAGVMVADDPGSAADSTFDVARLVELMKGVSYRGWIFVTLGDGDAARAGEIAETAAKRLIEMIDAPAVELTAYKGDKNAPRFVQRAPAFSPTAPAGASS